MLSAPWALLEPEAFTFQRTQPRWFSVSQSPKRLWEGEMPLTTPLSPSVSLLSVPTQRYSEALRGTLRHLCGRSPGGSEGPTAPAPKQLAGAKITAFPNVQGADPSRFAFALLGSRFSSSRYLVSCVTWKRGGAGEQVEPSISLLRPLAPLLSPSGFWEPRATILFLWAQPL